MIDKTKCFDNLYVQDKRFPNVGLSEVYAALPPIGWLIEDHLFEKHFV